MINNVFNKMICFVVGHRWWSWNKKDFVDALKTVSMCSKRTCTRCGREEELWYLSDFGREFWRRTGEFK